MRLVNDETGVESRRNGQRQMSKASSSPLTHPARRCPLLLKLDAKTQQSINLHGLSTGKVRKVRLTKEQ